MFNRFESVALSTQMKREHTLSIGHMCIKFTSKTMTLILYTCVKKMPSVQEWTIRKKNKSQRTFVDKSDVGNIYLRSFFCVFLHFLKFYHFVQIMLNVYGDALTYPKSHRIYCNGFQFDLLLHPKNTFPHCVECLFPVSPALSLSHSSLSLSFIHRRYWVENIFKVKELATQWNELSTSTTVGSGSSSSTTSNRFFSTSYLKSNKFVAIQTIYIKVGYDYGREAHWLYNKSIILRSKHSVCVYMYVCVYVSVAAFSSDFDMYLYIANVQQFKRFGK